MAAPKKTKTNRSAPGRSAARGAGSSAEHGRVLKRLLDASEYERKLIAFDIHDGMAQQLAGAIMQFEVAEHLRQSDPAEAARASQVGLAALRRCYAEARRLIAGVRPPILEESGIPAAIRHLVGELRPGDDPEIEIRGRATFPRLPAILENAVYRIAQEALTNACRHSRSPRVRVSLVHNRDRLRIEVRDWGVGFDPAAVCESCFGLAGIRERARLLGGTCLIRSKPGRGTTVVVELNMMEEEAS